MAIIFINFFYNRLIFAPTSGYEPIYPMVRVQFRQFPDPLLHFLNTDKHT